MFLGPMPSTQDLDRCTSSRKANIVAGMEYTTLFDFFSLDSSSSSFDSSFDSTLCADFGSIFNVVDGPLGWPTTDLEQLSGSAYTPCTFLGGGNGSEPMLLDEPVAIEHNWDAQYKPAPQLSQMLSSSNPQSCRSNIDQAYDDVSSPPSLSMSSTSSSESYSCSYESTPVTPRRLPRKSLKHHTARSSLPTIPQKKLEVLGNALVFNNPTPTADQSSFLAKSLDVAESVMESWQKALLVDNISILQGLKLGKPLQAGRVASWKQTIIRRGFQKVNTPSSCQIEFLAAGLRVKVEQLWQSFRDLANNDRFIGAKSRGRIETEVLPTTHLLKQPLPPSSDDEVQPVDSTIETVKNLDESAIAPLPSKPATVGVDSPPWNLLIESKTKSVNPVDVSDTKSQNCQRLQNIVDETKSVPDCMQAVEQTSGGVEIQVMSNIGDTDMESIENEEVPDSSPEEELATLLGPEYGHLAESILSRFAAASVWDRLQFTSGSREHASGVENTPSSNSSQTPGNASSPNTSASGSSSGKRKSSGSGGDGPGDLEPNDGDGNMDPPPPKKAKTPQTRYDCPIFRRSLRTGSTVRSCALNGLEFRNLWYVTLNIMSTS